eukprot:COSAG05_NODE_10711_length_550_cov_0.880266_1_plen_145_part_00
MGAQELHCLKPRLAGSLLMEMRQSTGNIALKRRQFSVSDSNGISWSPATTAPWSRPQQGNDCEASMVRLPNSARLVISSPFHDSGRLNLTIHVSDDSGASWQPYRQIDPGPSGYSSVAAINGSMVCLLWERKGTGLLYGTFQVS